MICSCFFSSHVVEPVHLCGVFAQAMFEGIGIPGLLLCFPNSLVCLYWCCFAKVTVVQICGAYSGFLHHMHAMFV